MHPLLTAHVHYTSGCSLLLITMIATLNFNPHPACSYLWGAVIVNFQVISFVGAQKATLHPDDILLLSNFILSSESFR
jgi:hypothetical protein